MNERLRWLKDSLHLLEAVRDGEVGSELPGAQQYMCGSGKHLHLRSDFRLLKVLPRNVNSMVRNESLSFGQGDSENEARENDPYMQFL